MQIIDRQITTVTVEHVEADGKRFRRTETETTETHEPGPDVLEYRSAVQAKWQVFRHARWFTLTGATATKMETRYQDAMLWTL